MPRCAARVTMTFTTMMRKNRTGENAEQRSTLSNERTWSTLAGDPRQVCRPMFRDGRQRIDLTKLKQALATKESQEAVELLLKPGKVGNDVDEQKLRGIAEHEVAHAVMRRICGLRVTTLVATPEWGFCEGSAEPTGKVEVLLVLLAGYVWEALDEGRDTDDIDLVPLRENSDIERVWEMLDDYTWLCLREHDDRKVEVMSVEDSMKVWAERAARLIWRYRRVIRSLGQELAAAGFLSARCLNRRLRHIEPSRKVQMFDLDILRALEN